MSGVDSGIWHPPKKILSGHIIQKHRQFNADSMSIQRRINDAHRYGAHWIDLFEFEFEFDGVWSGKGASVQGRGTGEVDWTRSQFVMECLSEHNRLRSLHSAPPLVLCEELCNDAQAWANRLAHFGILEYSSEHGRGENIMTSSAKEGLTGCAVARGWYETGRNFKYDMNGSADLAHAGPFSQVVWESTRAVGVGCARGSDSRMVVVARYWPQGNIGGQFSTNVKPPTSDCPLTPVNTGTPTMSRTRQEAHFYVSIALEPPGKNKKVEKEKIVAALKLPTKKIIGDDGVSGETLLAHPTTLETLGHSFTVCRNGAVRTSKLFPICCVTPAKTEERWATPSTRTQYQTQQPQSQADLAIIRRTVEEVRPGCTGSKLETGVHLSAEPLQKYKSNLKASTRLGVSPRLAVSPRLGVTTRLGTSPKLGALPKIAASRMTGSPKLIATSRFGGSPKRGSPKRSVLRRGGSPKPGSSPRRSATSRLRALTAAGEHSVIVATL
nr:uncharacterized protein LOC123770179 [Procambarus clarkii]